LLNKLANFAAARVQRLYNLGARHIWFSGLAPLGCIPSQRVLSDDGECLDDVNAYAIQFNDAAKNLIEGLNAKLPGARMYLSDCYSIVMELIDHPQKHGNYNKQHARDAMAFPARSQQQQ